ncbi:hypothetical protein AXF42_Ash018736 [Apostasia shenzhenica]|uniref:Uncharacterized protein n=1 Tax=Apostasia shenzhenica TaxID=1088818 RepID=A0A2I0AJU5_9ASPA|nr:hypothetical protein AXF42_Ash018736 [Apostasia shenzhenica]
MGNCSAVFVAGGVRGFTRVFRRKGGGQALGSRRLSATGEVWSRKRRVISFNICTSFGDP